MMMKTDLSLPEIGEIHLWWVPLPTEIQHVGTYYRILSNEERKRAASFYYQKDRDSYMISHGILRILLGRYLKEEPEGLRFTYHRFGKPCLETRKGILPLHFNLSHSDGLTVYAFSVSREVGIDVESTRTDISIEELAGTFLNLREIDDLMRHPANRRKESLLQYWVFKEAWLKASGQGIYFASKSFGSPDYVNQLAAVLKNGSQDSQATWSVRRLDAPQGYVAALVIEGQEDLIVKGHNWKTSSPG
jgi:4'-phosphopantetheinyl transferase